MDSWYTMRMTNKTTTVSSPFAIFSALFVNEHGERYWVTVPCEDEKKFIEECNRFCQYTLDKDEFDSTLNTHACNMENDERLKVLFFLYDDGVTYAASMNVVGLAEMMEKWVSPEAKKVLMGSLNMNEGCMFTLNKQAKQHMENYKKN